MPTKFIELTEIGSNEKVLINVDHISKFYSDDKGTMIWIDGGYICVKEKYTTIKNVIINGFTTDD